MPESFLKQIIQTKKEELAHFQMPAFDRKQKKIRSLIKALSTPRHPFGLIAEIKQASPSKGLFRKDFNAANLANIYEHAGADAISVLTDRTYFHGSLERLRAVREAVNLPILRKDFILDERQIEEAYLAGADAILLIAAAMEPKRLRNLYLAAESIGLESLVEVHSIREADAVFNLFSPQLVGINNRNLTTFQTDLSVTRAVRPSIPDQVLVVSESGVHEARDIDSLRRYNARAALIGEALICANYPEKKINELFGKVTAHAADA
ncbi:MAG: indole-3-glycerol phosphate synthase TrpC [Sporolactobacillus sp.]